MALMRRDPLLADLLARPLLTWPEWLGDLPAALRGEDIPVEEFEEEGARVIRAELPGVDPDRDIEVTVQNGVLHIRAERHREEKTEKPHYIRQELSYGAFVRELPLPADVAAEDVTAEYKDGILTVRVPLGTEKTGATKIQVTRG